MNIYIAKIKRMASVSSKTISKRFIDESQAKAFIDEKVRELDNINHVELTTEIYNDYDQLVESNTRYFYEW